MHEQPFSQQLEVWLKSDKPKTLQSLIEVFSEKTFAIIVLLLMFLPALPLPTAAHPLELITMLLSVEMIAGRKAVWLPKFLLERDLGKATIHRAIPFIMKRIRWFEQFSRPRFQSLLEHPLFLRLTGLIIFIFALGAFVALPPPVILDEASQNPEHPSPDRGAPLEVVQAAEHRDENLLGQVVDLIAQPWDPRQPAADQG